MMKQFSLYLVLLLILLPISGFAATAPSIASPAPSGLVSWWAGNSNTIDSVSGYNGTASGVTYAIGNSGEAFNFDGTGSVSVADTAALHPSQFSVSLWFNWDNVGTSNVEFLLAKGMEHYEIHTGGGAGVNGIRFIPAGYSSPSTSVDATNVITTGWHHLVVTYSGSAATIYVDGIVRGSRTGITGGANLSADTAPLLMGKRSNGSYVYHGKIDEVLFFNRVLTGAEITAIYNTQTASITTVPAAPGITTATLKGVVSDNGADTATFFEYGTTVSYGSEQAVIATIPAGNGATPVSAALSGLSSGTVYHFRLKAVNTAGTTYGPDQTFSTALVLSTTRLDPTATTSIYGQSITLWGYADPTSATTGKMTFRYYDSVKQTFQILGVVPLSSGMAHLTTSVIPATAQYVSALYSGDSTYSASQRNVMMSVSKAATTATLTSNSSSTILTGQNVTYTAAILPTTATGTIGFRSDGNLLGTAPIINGTAVLTVSFPSVQTTNIMAVYDGDTNHLSSWSSQYIQTVVTPVSIAAAGAGVTTLNFLSATSGNGYFTLLRGVNTACGAASAVAAGQSASGGVADYHGSLALTAGAVGAYTVRNLQQNTAYTACLTVLVNKTLSSLSSTSFTTSSGAGVGKEWLAAGGTTISDYAVARNSMAVASDGAPYLAYTDGYVQYPYGYDYSPIGVGNGGKITVKKLDGTTWVTVGAAGISGEPIIGTNSSYFAMFRSVEYHSLAFSPFDIPYIALTYNQYIDAVSCRCMDDSCSNCPTGTLPPGSVTRVMKFNGTAWEYVGSYWTYGVHPSLAFAPDGMPWVAYGDGTNGNKATVRKFNGTDWVTVGTSGFSDGAAVDTTLAFTPDGTPLCAYRDNGANGKVTVKKLDGSSWVLLGNAAFTAGSADYLTMAVAPDGTPHVAFKDSSVGGKATVMKYNGSAWGTAGSAGLTAGVADSTSLVITPNNVPLLLYSDGGNGGKVGIAAFDGNIWNSRGSSFSNGAVYGIFPALAPNGQLYAAFSDGGNGNKVSVMKAKYDSSTTISSSSNPVIDGDAFTLSAPVQCSAWPYGGTVTFLEGTTILGTGTFDSFVIGYNVASLNVSSLGVGSHTITAVYGGDGNCAGSTSSALVQVVNKRPTTTTISSSSNPSLAGDQSAVLSAPVHCSAWPYGGTVTFMEGANILGTGSFSSFVVGYNLATLNISTLGIGSHIITAVYGGDENCAGSSSTALVQVVNKRTTTTTISSSSNPSFAGDQSAVLSAPVHCSAWPYGGTVTFMEGATILGTGSFDSFIVGHNVATLNISSLGVGSHTITAVYGGDNYCAASTSSALVQVVTPATLTVSVSGAGDGTVSSIPQGVDPVGISCMKQGGACNTTFSARTEISVSALPDAVSLFDHWEGACAGQPNPCTVSMDDNKQVSVVFSAAPLAKNSTRGTTYATLSDALAAANSATPDTIRLIGVDYDGAVTLSSSVVLSGGWNALYQALTGLPTVLNNGLTVTGGSSLLETIYVKGKLTIRGGSLQVSDVTVR